VFFTLSHAGGDQTAAVSVDAVAEALAVLLQFNVGGDQAAAVLVAAVAEALAVCPIVQAGP